jgi:hypothetical protein
MARERNLDGLRVTSAPAYDNSTFRVYVVWAPGRENFTYHYVANPRAAARYMRLPGPTEGAMAAGLAEFEDGEWTDWYSDDGLDIDECIEEGVVLSA